MSAPVLSRLFTVKGRATRKLPFSVRRAKPCSSPLFSRDHSSSGSLRRARVHNSLRRAASNLGSARTLRQGPLHPTLRANPFPEVTDLFCRLPLSTLFYRPEAANLGDLMRLWVRPGVRISLSLGFSRGVEKAPDTSEDKVLFPTFNPISR